MSPARWIERNYRRMQARTVGQLVRGASLRLWPLSDLVHQHYRLRLGASKWYAINERARRHFESHAPRLDAGQRRALADMKRDGFHVTTLPGMLKGAADLAAIREDADRLMRRPIIREQIESRLSREGIKWYVVRAFGYKPRMAVPASFAALLLSDGVLGVVNSYLGLASRLKYLDIWHNFAVSESDPPVDSERWHRDNEDRNIVKLFLHLSDVDETAGPLTYLRGSQPGGPLGSLFPTVPPSGSYPPDGALAACVTPEATAACTGAAGTMVLFDACGLHRGGRATGRPRTLLVATYASDAALDPLKYRLADPAQYHGLSTQARYAIRAPEC
jgi:hypothetical protein